MLQCLGEWCCSTFLFVVPYSIKINWMERWNLRVLNIYLGDMKDAIYHPPTYFDNQYEDEWLTDKTAIQMIRDVDHSEVISALSD